MRIPIRVSYEDEELRALAILAEWAWIGAGLPDWPAEHTKTLGQMIAAAAVPLEEAVADGIYRMALAGCGDFPLARVKRAEAAGRIGIRQAAEAILASGGEPLVLAGLLNKLAANRIGGPVVRNRGRWSAFGYLETAVAAGLTHQRALASRGRRVLWR